MAAGALKQQKATVLGQQLGEVLQKRISLKEFLAQIELSRLRFQGFGADKAEPLRLMFLPSF
jgi:hypothetical protein